MDKGYIKLNRSFFDNRIWQAARAFSECEAWLDLIQSARFEATPTTSRIGCYEVTWGRGQYPASIRFLSKKWGRPEKWVREFLSRLRKEQMITMENTQGLSVITLLNYEKYNGDTPDDAPKGTPNGTPKGTPNGLDNSDLQALTAHLTAQVTAQVLEKLEKRGTPTAQIIRKEKKDIKENTTSVVSKKDAAHAATLARKEEFYSTLVPYVDRYPREMIRAFFDYWSEMNKSRTRMRFEQQPTWEVAKRLATWARREKPSPRADTGVVLADNSPDKYKRGW